MKSKILFYCLLALALTACSKEETGEVTAAELIRSITAAPQSENALRVDIHLDFKKAVSYQIEYWKAGDETSVQTTPLSEPVTSDKCTLILLKAQSDYNFRVHASTDNQTAESDVYKFTTSPLPSTVPTASLLNDKMGKSLPGYILLMRNEKPGVLTLTDTEGEVVWYHLFQTSASVASFDPQTNTIACILGNNPKNAFAGNEIIVMDLYGNTLLKKDVTDLFVHHEIRRLPNGDLMMVHFTPKDFDLTAQGGSKTETVFGDGIIVMDMKGNIKWDWDCYTERSPVDDPRIMDKIEMLNMTYSQDWLHANSATMDEEGNFYITFNWLSEMWKIDAKTKKVIYRLGTKGNVEQPQDSFMEGVHCVSAINKNQVLVFDNGMQAHRSRGLLFTINESTKKAELTHNITLPSEYSSMYMGSVRKINDDLFIFGPTLSNAVLFTDAKGNILRTLKTSNQSYRAEYIPQITQ